MKYIAMDLDGTMLDSMSYWRNLAYKYLKSRNLTVDEELNKKLNSMPLNDSCKFLIQHFELSDTPKEFYEGIKTLLIEPYKTTIPLKPYVKEFLENAKNSDIRLCVATAAENIFVMPALERLGLSHFFDFVQTSENVGLSKADPRFFEKIKERFELQDEEIILFDDSYYALASAKTVGFKVVGVKDLDNLNEEKKIKSICDFYIEDFKDLDVNFI